MIEWVGQTIVWLDLWHLEPMKNRFTQNLSRERWLSIETEAVVLLMTTHLELDDPLFQTLKHRLEASLLSR